MGWMFATVLTTTWRLSGDSITSHICQLVNTVSRRTELMPADLCKPTCIHSHATEWAEVGALCVHLHKMCCYRRQRSKNTLGLSLCSATDATQKKKKKRVCLFKGFYNTVQMPNFVVFHLFPVLSVPASDIRVTSGLAGEILGLSAGCAAKIGPAAMNLDVR